MAAINYEKKFCLNRLISPIKKQIQVQKLV